MFCAFADSVVEKAVGACYAVRECQASIARCEEEARRTGRVSMLLNADFFRSLCCWHTRILAESGVRWARVSPLADRFAHVSREPALGLTARADQGGPALSDAQYDLYTDLVVYEICELESLLDAARDQMAGRCDAEHVMTAAVARQCARAVGARLAALGTGAGDVRARVNRFLRAERLRREAVCMGQHARLGAASPLLLLEPALVQLILRSVR